MQNDSKKKTNQKAPFSRCRLGALAPRMRAMLIQLIRHSPLRQAYYEGRLSLDTRRRLAVNWFFQRVIGVNRFAPWSVYFTSQVLNPSKIQMGAGVWRSMALSGGLYVNAFNGICIGDDTLIAPGVKLISANHGPARARAALSEAPIVIGSRCWLGANVVILPGVVLGDETTVGAGAVVTRSFPQGHCTLVGLPARPLIAVSQMKTGEE